MGSKDKALEGKGGGKKHSNLFFFPASIPSQRCQPRPTARPSPPCPDPCGILRVRSDTAAEETDPEVESVFHYSMSLLSY